MNKRLKTAGTGTNYVGLFESVRNFRSPTAEQLSSLTGDFPESAKVSGLVDLMVEIDERWDHLKAARKADYETFKDQPDLQPDHEAVILGEHFREAQRLSEALGRGSDFMDRLKRAEAEANEAERLLRLFLITLVEALRRRLCDEDFIARHRVRHQDFTRQHRLTIPIIVLFVLQKPAATESRYPPICGRCALDQR